MNKYIKILLFVLLSILVIASFYEIRESRIQIDSMKYQIDVLKEELTEGLNNELREKQKTLADLISQEKSHHIENVKSLMKNRKDIVLSVQKWSMYHDYLVCANYIGDYPEYSCLAGIRFFKNKIDAIRFKEELANELNIKQDS